MPFTLAHPAAALPFRRLAPGMLLPLVIGNVAPDLPYYVPFLGEFRWRHFGHRAFGAFAFSWPAGLAVVVLLVLLRGPVLAPLWGAHRVLAGRVYRDFLATPGHWWRAALAVLAGVWMHILWDAFTHDHNGVVRFFPWLRTTFRVLDGRDVAVYRLLQYASSVFGLAVLAALWHAAARRVPAAAAAAFPRGRRPWLLAGLLAAAAVVGVAGHLLEAQHDGSLYLMIGSFLTDAVAAFCAAYVIAGALVLKSVRRP